MLLQRHGKNGLPRNEFKEQDEREYNAYVRRTGDTTWKPVRMKSKDVKLERVMPEKKLTHKLEE